MDRFMVRTLIVAATVAGMVSCGVVNTGMAAEPVASTIRTAAQSGTIAYRLTEPGEITALLGEPVSREQQNDGGMVLLFLEYPDTKLVFGRMRRESEVPFTLRGVMIGSEHIDIGRDRKLVLRNNGDLNKIDRFHGLQNVSLVNVDLRSESELANELGFDSLTEWPDEHALPAGFDPTHLLESGKNPGLGLRAIHAEGITGQGVGIAVIDQPLLLGHQEYTANLIRYDATGLAGFAPQMHGSPVASIAVGQSVGVAPGATLTYFAVPMWENTCAHYIRALQKIMTLNDDVPADERIRVVSISDGAFASYAEYATWQLVLAKAGQRGIFVITCAYDTYGFGTLTLKEGTDPDQTANYRPGPYSGPEDVLRVPTGNKTLASHRGIDVYTFERDGGRSWAAPYITGLAACAFQIKPDLRPEQIFTLLVETATITEAGPIICPQKFLGRIRQSIKSGR